MVKNTENVISLYSGGGGLDIGFRLAIPNARTVCYVEREISSVAVLVKAIENKYLDDAPIWTNSTTFDGSPWVGKVDWIIGGFPCQPWSVAGKREGKEDERWLWDDIKQIALSVRPKGFFLENVSGLITGHGIDTILGDLSEMGFDAQWGSVKAGDIGASHRRERVFILAARRGTDCRFNDILGNTESYGSKPTPKFNRRDKCESLNGNKVRNIASTTSNTELDNSNSNEHKQQVRGSDGEEKKIQNEHRKDNSTSRKFIRASNSGELGNSDNNDESSIPRNEYGKEKQFEPGQSSKYVGNTKRKGLERHSEHSSSISKKRQEGKNSGDVSSSSPRELADTNGQRPNEIQIHRKHTSIKQLGNSKQEEINIPSFPPSPDSEQWPDIIGQYPELSPALEKSAFKPDIRRVADGMAARLHRVDRLRILGNGVVPIQAAYAFTVLARRIETFQE